MLTVDDYGAIRRARRDGMSIRQISREFGHTRKTVRHVLGHAEPPASTNRDRKAPLLGPVVLIIDRILADDEDAPAKQRHTAAQIHRRLRDEHAYLGGYAQVQRYVLKHRRRDRETFIPLGHPPGRRLGAAKAHSSKLPRPASPRSRRNSARPNRSRTRPSAASLMRPTCARLLSLALRLATARDRSWLIVEVSGDRGHVRGRGGFGREVPGQDPSPGCDVKASRGPGGDGAYPGPQVAPRRDGESLCRTALRGGFGYGRPRDRRAGRAPAPGGRRWGRSAPRPAG